MNSRWPDLYRQPSYIVEAIQEKRFPALGKLWGLASECDWKMLELDSEAYQLYLSLRIGELDLKPRTKIISVTLVKLAKNARKSVRSRDGSMDLKLYDFLIDSLDMDEAFLQHGEFLEVVL